ncbi:MAG: NAD-dependent succinate-semialdehyde dehydrogenase [Betaproteobacteria bacterium]
MAEFAELGQFVHGELLADRTASTIPVIDPATGAELGRLPQADDLLLARILESTRDGFGSWSKVPAYERANVLRRAAGLIRDRAEALAHVMTLEQGKPLTESKIEWLMTADALEWAAEEGRRVYGRVIPSRTLGVSQVVHKFPVGPVAAFAPWNFPAFSPAQKIAPALAAGCSVVLKPASDTPASAVLLAQLLHESGIARGALNVVHGSAARVSQYLVASPIIRKVSLTGSVEVGRLLAAEAGRHLKKCTMELGGHAPVLVLRDADAERVAPLAVAAKFRNAGQVCTSPTRFIVDGPIYERFVAAFLEHAARLKIGNGLEPGVQMGPLVSARQVRAMVRLVDDARSKGADVCLGGRPIETGSGFFFEPTVIRDAPEDSLVRREEPFGPIAIMIRVDGIDEAIQRANELPYGLASYCFTHHASNIDRIARELEAGMLAFNQFQAGAIEAPFGGVKDSGFGAEGGTEGVDGYLVTKFVSHRAI